MHVRDLSQLVVTTLLVALPLTGVLRVTLERDLDLDVVAINELGPPQTMVGLLTRDSIHGRFPEPVTAGEGHLQIGDRLVRLLAERDPAALPWRDLGVTVVIESTGHFNSRAACAGHLAAGAERVVVSAPCKDADGTFVIGVNDATFDPGRHHVVSNASCTTNCLAPMIKVLQDRFGIERGFMTTVHAYTGDQMLVDGPHKDAWRARAAALNIVPTSTGAARATSAVIEEMAGRLDGTALRVPVADGSITDLTVVLDEETTVDDVNAAFAAAASTGMAGVLEYSTEPLVSTDIVGAAASCVFDAGLTMVSGRLVKVFGWYDNEWGYANRLAELTALVAGDAR